MKFVAIKPVVGMELGYATEKSSLRVEVISYDESNNRVGLRVLKKLKEDPECPYEEGYEFFLERNLEGLILD